MKPSLEEQIAAMEQLVGLQPNVVAMQQEDTWRAILASLRRVKTLEEALKNCSMLARRHRREEWAQHIMRFAESAGIKPSVLRLSGDETNGGKDG